MSRKTKTAAKLEEEAAQKRRRDEEFVTRMQLEHKRAMDLAGAIEHYLRNSCDPTLLKEWYLANTSFAEYQMASCFNGLRFSDEYDCLPDEAKYPIFLAVYVNILRSMNDPSHLVMIDRPPLPTLKFMCEPK